MVVSPEIADAIFQAESVLADYRVAVEKGYVSEATTAVFKAADQIRAFQKKVQTVHTYTVDMPRPNCPECGRPVEQPDNPEKPWKGVCSAGHEYKYQLDLEDECEGS